MQEGHTAQACERARGDEGFRLLLHGAFDGASDCWRMQTAAIRSAPTTMPAAARLTDLHICPMQTPAVPPIPHVGGPIAGPGCPTVLIGGLPAAVLGDSCVCVGPPDSIIKGSATVLIGGKPAARMGDSTSHGGSIAIGCPTVQIGG